MENIIPAASPELIISELTQDRFVRKTNFGGNEIYIVNHLNAPHVMQEIGRLREITFRAAGGGTGKSTDIDEFDISEHHYQQLIVWDPDAREILGGYRFFICQKRVPGCMKSEYLATHEIFEFSEKFVNEFLPYTIELGRSFVQPDYQSTRKARKSLYALDNLWDGLGALVADNPDVLYFFGKVTMYTHYNVKARNLILHFLSKNFPDPDRLVWPRHPLVIEHDEEEMKQIFTGANYKENYKILSQQVRALGENIPPLINAYMNLSQTLRVFGTCINEGFGSVEETGLMIHILDLNTDKVERYIHTYTREKGDDIRIQ
jgi:putative hemolysin